jgi:hypothetical protein
MAITPTAHTIAQSTPTPSAEGNTEDEHSLLAVYVRISRIHFTVNGDNSVTTYHTRRDMMSKRRVMLLLVALLFATVYLAGAGSALAVPPEQRTILTNGTFVLAECDGFDVMDEFNGRLTVTEFYDQNGELVRLTFQQFDHDRIYNSVTGFSVSSRFVVNQTLYPEEGELYIRGLAYNITVPGYGIVFFDSGLGVFYNVDDQWVLVKFAGNYQPDTELLCEAMDQ